MPISFRFLVVFGNLYKIRARIFRFHPTVIRLAAPNIFQPYSLFTVDSLRYFATLLKSEPASERTDPSFLLFFEFATYPIPIRDGRSEVESEVRSLLVRSLEIAIQILGNYIDDYLAVLGFNGAAGRRLTYEKLIGKGKVG
jgi:hypothetical protein